MSWWPAHLVEGDVGLRPLQVSDARAWRDARNRNAAWLKPWEATVPPNAPGKPPTFRGMVRTLQRMARDGQAMPFAVTVEERFAGQVTVSNIVRGSAQFASIGYWIDERYAGRGVIPLAVAMTIDHCFFAARLHRIEISIRPENVNSLRVVEKLGMKEFGYAERYLHIDGQWRDHRQFAVTLEECPQGMLNRLRGR